MKNLKSRSVISSVVLFCLPPVLFVPQNIHAYIDAGTGSLIIQFLIAGAVGGLFLVKLFWRKMKAFLSNLLRRKGNG